MSSTYCYVKASRSTTVSSGCQKRIMSTYLAFSERFWVECTIEVSNAANFPRLKGYVSIQMVTMSTVLPVVLLIAHLDPTLPLGNVETKVTGDDEVILIRVRSDSTLRR